jgi:hypothetical protein
MLEEIALGIRDRLQPLQDAGVAVRLLPNKVAEYGQPFKNGQVTIMWAQDRATDLDSADLLQQQLIEWALELRMPSFWDGSGIDKVMQAIALLLNGWQPPQGGQTLRLAKREFLGEKDGLWVAIVYFAQRTYVVSAIAEDEGIVGTLLSEITLQSAEFGSVIASESEEI